MELKVIRSEEQYREYCEKLRDLLSKEKDEETEERIEHLSLLIEDWEKKNRPDQDADPIELLKFLMNNHGLKQNDLAKLLEISKGAVSQILNYRKGLSKEVVRKLSEHFKVSQEAFNREYRLIDEANRGRKLGSVMNVAKASRES